MRRWLPLLALAACSAEPARIELPARGTSRSMIVVVERIVSLRAELLHLTAVDLAAPAGALPSIPKQDLDEELRITALRFDATLGELGLRSGPIPALESGDMGRVIPMPKGIEERTVHGDDLGSWRRVEAPSRSVADLRLPSLATDPCLGGEPQNLLLGPKGTITVLAPISDDRAFVTAWNTPATGPEEFNAFVVSAAGRVSPAELPALAGPVVMFTSVTRRDDEVWIGRTFGSVIRAHVEDTRLVVDQETRTTTRTGEHHVLRLAVSRADEPLELFVIDGLNELHHWDGARWAHVATLPLRIAFDHADVVRLGPGRAYAITGAVAEATIYDGGTITREALPLTLEAPYCLADIPGYGLLMGTSKGNIWQRDPESRTWTKLGHAYDNPVEIIVPFRDGFLAAGEDGFTAHYRKNGGFCAARQLGSTSVRRLIFLGDTMVMGGDVPTALDLQAARLTVLHTR